MALDTQGRAGQPWEGDAMHRRSSVRVLAVAAMLVIAATPIGGGVQASTRSSPVPSGARSTLDARLPLHAATSRLKAHSIAHGSMSRASDRTQTGSAPRMPSPLAGAKPSQPGAQGPRTVTPTPVEATPTTNPPIGQPGFDGLSRSGGPDTNGEPPDPWVAVGPEHVMQITNSSFRTTDRQGVGVEQSSLAGFVDTFSFSELANAHWFDPHVVYDSLHGRWLLTADGYDCSPTVDANYGIGYLFFATSDTIDPTGDWTGAYLWAPDFLIDYSAPGTSSDKFAFGSNFYSMALSGSCPDGNYVGTEIDALDWADWLSPEGVWDFASFGTDNTAFAPRIALQSPATNGRLHGIIETLGAGPGTDVAYFSLNGSVAARTLGVDVDFDLSATGAIGQFLLPPAPNQPGPDTISLALDERPTDAIWQNNLLTFVSTYPCTPSGDSTQRDCVRVSQLDTTGVNATTPPTLAQDFLIAENGEDSYMGGVGMAGNGTLNVLWSRSSATAGDYPSSYAAYQLPTDDPNSISPKELLQAGTGAYSGERWGDYVGVAQDPYVPSRVWQANQYSGGGTEWKTYVSQLQPAGTTYIPVPPVRVLDTRTATGLSGMFTSSIARTWQVAGAFGIPATAVAVTGNVTVTGQQAGGYVSVTPTPTNTPATSSINFPLGDTRANNLTVSLSPTGSLSAVYKSASGKKTQLVFDVTGYFLADDSGATFMPISPVRVLDTRTSTGLSGKFISGSPRTLKIADTHGIPATATAITGNVTVVQQSGGGYISVTQTSTATPTTSTLNFPVGDVRANGLFAPLDGSGTLSIVYKSSTGATTQVVLDVTGYFEPGTGGLRFVPLNPGRIMDTRVAVLPGLSGAFKATVPRILPVDGHWGVPVGAAAVIGNLTVTAQTGGGYVTVSPDAPPPAPSTSSINFPLGDTRANGLVGPLNGTGDTYLVYMSAAGRTAHLILDLSGYFK